MSNNNRHEVIIKIGRKDWEEALDKAFVKKVKDIKVSGFRKGKVPRDVYEKKFGKESLYMEAIDYVLPNAYTKALSDSKLIPVVQPKVDIKGISDEGIEFKFDIITKPKVKLGKYKGLKVEKPTVKVTKEEIEHEIDRLRRQYSELVIKEGKVESGDIAVIDFEGFKDGVSFEGGKGTNYPLEIGSNTFIESFEEQLVGMAKNESKDIDVTFPDNYPNEDLKGKKVTFKVMVLDIKERKIPELDENFFKDLAMEGINSKEELEKEMKNKISANKEYENENIYLDNLLEAVSKNVEVDIPNEMIEEEIDRMLVRYREQLSLQGIELEQYYQLTNTKEADLRGHMSEQATKNVMYRLMLEEIAIKEKIDITDEEVAKEATTLANKYKMPKDEFLKLFGGLDMVKYDLQMRRTLELLKENN